MISQYRAGKEKRNVFPFLAERGNLALVKLLLTWDHIDINSKDRCDWTPLMHAARNGDAMMVEYLMCSLWVE